jgi:hypothetical protein
VLKASTIDYNPSAEDVRKTEISKIAALLGKLGGATKNPN